MAGRVGIGGANPLRVQSMATADTCDVEAVTAQVLRLAEAGCEIARLAVPTLEAARALEKIKAGLLRRGADIPIVADIHFSPEAALIAADFVEKIRINPGNFADSKTFAKKDLTPAQYDRELERVRARFLPLLDKLKRLQRALRIGVNHGSLSDRIMNRYGDTPLGMVESALEFARLCEEQGYRELVFSMKSSNVKVMIAAYRLLARRMAEIGMDYPFHLGVTEAGEGEDGRIKSAIGIGSLLEDGIGDTLRVSLTEEPEREIPVCRALAKLFEGRKPMIPGGDKDLRYGRDLYSYSRRKSRRIVVDGFGVGGAEPIRVVTRSVAGRVDPGPEIVPGALPPVLFEAESAEEVLHLGLLARQSGKEVLLGLRGDDSGKLLREYRRLAALAEDFPLLLRAPRRGGEEVQVLDASILLGSLLCDGIGDVVQIDSNLEPRRELELCYAILQNAGVRISRAEFISCPGCGRTLYDLQAAVERVKKEMGHLKGLKIAVMGCIVNGPGEMADADFGYVGGASGKINLYVGRECVRKGVPEAQAVEALKALIKESGRWIEKVP